MSWGNCLPDTSRIQPLPPPYLMFHPWNSYVGSLRIFILLTEVPVDCILWIAISVLSSSVPWLQLLRLLTALDSSVLFFKYL